jgi:hypothetical protein
MEGTNRVELQKLGGIGTTTMYLLDSKAMIVKKLATVWELMN